MDAEQLRMILDTIKSVAGTAGTAGVVWICIHYFVQLIMAIASPVCWVIGVVMTARYASSFFGTRVQTASADEIEKTKQKQIDLEKAKVEATKHEATVQLRKIAKEANVSFSEYSGIFLSSEFNKIIEKVKAQ
jgi:hypothetical protein